ncbi:MAG: hypothetical protein H7840_17965 [Alphaproteobacteria bacterium]
MILLPIALDTVAPIVAAMREADRSEVFALRWTDDDPALVRDIVARVQVGFVAADDKGRPVALVGAAEILPRLWSVAMFATDAWPTVALAVTRHLPRRLRHRRRSRRRRTRPRRPTRSASEPAPLVAGPA